MKKGMFCQGQMSCFDNCQTSRVGHRALTPGWWNKE